MRTNAFRLLTVWLVGVFTMGMAAAGEIWVDFTCPSASPSGTEQGPFCTLADAVAVAGVDDTVLLRGDSTIAETHECPCIAEPMRIKAVGGGVRIGTPAPPPLVEVPLVVNLHLSYVTLQLDDAGLTLGNVTTAWSSLRSNTADYCLSQNPAPGAIVPEGTPVDVVLSMDPAEYTVLGNGLGPELRKERQGCTASLYLYNSIADSYIPYTGRLTLQLQREYHDVPSTEVTAWGKAADAGRWYTADYIAETESETAASAADFGRILTLRHANMLGSYNVSKDGGLTFDHFYADARVALQSTEQFTITNDSDVPRYWSWRPLQPRGGQRAVGGYEYICGDDPLHWRLDIKMHLYKDSYTHYAYDYAYRINPGTSVLVTADIEIEFNYHWYCNYNGPSVAGLGYRYMVELPEDLRASYSLFELSEGSDGNSNGSPRVFGARTHGGLELIFSQYEFAQSIADRTPANPTGLTYLPSLDTYVVLDFEDRYGGHGDILGLETPQEGGVQGALLVESEVLRDACLSYSSGSEEQPGGTELDVVSIPPESQRELQAYDGAIFESTSGGQVAILHGGDLLLLDLSTQALVPRWDERSAVFAFEPSWVSPRTTWVSMNPLEVHRGNNLFDELSNTELYSDLTADVEGLIGEYSVTDPDALASFSITAIEETCAGELLALVTSVQYESFVFSIGGPQNALMLRSNPTVAGLLTNPNIRSMLPHPTEAHVLYLHATQREGTPDSYIARYNMDTGDCDVLLTRASFMTAVEEMSGDAPEAGLQIAFESWCFGPDGRLYFIGTGRERYLGNVLEDSTQAMWALTVE